MSYEIAAPALLRTTKLRVQRRKRGSCASPDQRESAPQSCNDEQRRQEPAGCASIPPASRRGFPKIGFHADATDSRPRLLSAERPVHQVAELMEERDHIAVIHQAGISRRRRRESCKPEWLRAVACPESHPVPVTSRHGCTCPAGDACRDKSGRSLRRFQSHPRFRPMGPTLARSVPGGS